MQNNTLTNFFNWWSNTNQGLALIGIALGIIAKFFYEYTIKYLRARNKSSVRFDWKGFGLTVLLSGFLAIVMYSGLLSAVAQLKNDLLVLSVAAQNGFFWQTLIDKLGEEKTKIVLKNKSKSLESGN
jgi:Na+(H+)/acetate symporter ActP